MDDANHPHHNLPCFHTRDVVGAALAAARVRWMVNWSTGSSWAAAPHPGDRIAPGRPASHPGDPHRTRATARVAPTSSRIGCHDKLWYWQPRCTRQPLFHTRATAPHPDDRATPGRPRHTRATAPHTGDRKGRPYDMAQRESQTFWEVQVQSGLVISNFGIINCGNITLLF